MKFVFDDLERATGYEKSYPAVHQCAERMEEVLDILAFVQGIKDDKGLSTKLSCSTGHKRSHASGMFEEQGTFGPTVVHVTNQFGQVAASAGVEFAQKLGKNGTHYTCSFSCAFVPEIAVKEHDSFPILKRFLNLLDYGSAVEMVNFRIKDHTFAHVNTVFPAPAATNITPSV